MAMNEDQVLNAFEASLGQSEEQPAAVPSAKQANAPQAQAQPAEQDQEQPQAQAEETVEAQAGEEEQSAETIEIDPEEPLFEQEIDDDGKKVTQKLSLKELQQGYLRQKDYTRKTQELARQRDELPQTIAKQSKELAESYTKRLSEIEQLTLRTVAEELQGKDLNKLANEDPFEYVRVSNRINQIKQLLQTIQTEKQNEDSKRAEEEKKNGAQRWAKSLEVLTKDIPDFGPAVVKRLIEAGQDWGYSAEEVAQFNDHRQIKMLYELTQRKAVDSKKPAVEKKVALVTKTLKPGQKQPQKTAIDEARSRLRKTGKAEDALPIFEAMLR